MANNDLPLLQYLESTHDFKALTSRGIRRLSEELDWVNESDVPAELFAAGWHVLLTQCYRMTELLSASPIELVFVRSVMFAFLRNAIPLVFMRAFDDALTGPDEFRGQLSALRRFTSWYTERFNSTAISKEYLDVEVESGRLPDEERYWLEELLIFYHYLNFEDSWHVSLQPQFPDLLGDGRASTCDMLFWIPERPSVKVLVECDGFRFHRGQKNFVRDRRKDRALKKLGFEVFRFSGFEINNSPAEVGGELFLYLMKRLEEIQVLTAPVDQESSLSVAE